MPSLVRNTLIAFLAGWVGWFWIDKQGPAYRMAAGFPGGEELTQDLQFGFDLLKSGELGPAFVFLWDQHYLLLALVGGALLSLALGSVGRLKGRLPRRPASKTREAEAKPSDPT